ncbi:MAG: hypothetical protein AB8H86_24410 [Polyangiales bacterium]
MPLRSFAVFLLIHCFACGDDSSASDGGIDTILDGAAADGPMNDGAADDGGSDALASPDASADGSVADSGADAGSDGGEPEEVRAFPSAYGGGANSTGGRGGNVYHVTSLVDDSSEGTFRWALAQERPATIVFDVSGVIELSGNLFIEGDDLTIAGQSAPEGGITVTIPPLNYDFFIKTATNIVLRYLRVRGQFYGDTAFKVDPGNFTDGRDYAHDIMLDHMSINWSGLQALTVRGYDTHHITFQNGLIAESKTGSLFGDTSPDNTGWSRNNTFRNTLFYNISHRTPNTASNGVDVYNNVVYNWLYRLSTVVNGGNVNHFNNYYFLGQRTSLFYQWMSQAPRWEVNGGTNSDPEVDISIYSAGNIVQDLFTDPEANNPETLWIEHANSAQTERLDPSFFVDERKPMQGRVGDIMTAVEASTFVPSNAGACRYLNADGSVGIYRDAADERYVTNTINDTPEPYNNSGATDNRHTAIDEQPYADFLASVSTAPINTRPGDFYVSNPHIPEPWFRANVPAGEDHNDLAPSGYTWLEEYLNGVDR